MMARSEELKGAFPEDTLQVLLDANAILENDHFVSISGDHSSGWIDKDAIYPHTERVEHLCRNLGSVVRDRQIEVVCGPATGGLIIAEWTGREIGALSTFTDHDQPNPGELRGKFILRRGYDHVVHGKRVLVVDDIINTGYSIKQTITAVREAHGEVVAAAALVSRGNVGADGLGVQDYIYLLEYKIPCWPAAECPLCARSVPINTQFAHGADFLAARAKS